MKPIRFLPVLLMALCCNLAVLANHSVKVWGDSIVVQGSILNSSTKKPVGEVTILLSPASGKTQVKELKSNASGFFVFPQLPVGEFTLQFKKKGYKTYKKDYIMLKEGGLQLRLLLEEDDEEEESEVDSWNPLKMLYGK